MANNKKQKRSAKLKSRSQKQQISKANRVFVDEQKICMVIPDDAKRMEYIKTLALDFENMIGA